jgi:uncharacterized repeat protein (TIGR03803 family)
MRNVCLLGRATAGVAAVALLASCGSAANATPGLGLQIAAPQSVTVSSYKTLYSFLGPPDGEEPAAGLTPDKGFLYGTTSLGGFDGAPCNACGTVYKIDSKGKEHVLYRFAGPPDGEFPESSLAEVNGAFYGTTYSGGTSACSGHCGTVFKVTRLGDERIVYSFTGKSDGSNPEGGLLYFNRVFYGTTSTSNAGAGTLYSLSLSGKIEVLHAFSGEGGDGATPVGNLVEIGGLLYGVTEKGGEDNLGTVFSFSPFGTSYKVLYRFSGADGEYPVGLVAVKGSLYGATSAGGRYKRGIIFSLTTNGAFNLVYGFRGYPKLDGAYPEAPPIILGKILYGTTKGGGAHGNGTVYELTTNGAESVMHSFDNPPDGVHPFAPLAFFKGLLYGTTENGGSTSTYGTVFRLSP